MQDEESDFEYASNSIRFDTRPADAPDFRELIRLALLKYEDVREDEFTLVNDPDGSNSTSDAPHHYNRHTLVPIGANFQVVVPPIISEAAYRAKSAQMMRVLRILKLNDPQEGGQFYDQHAELVIKMLGPERTYEDVNLLRNAFNKLNSRETFESYLSKHVRHWQNYFRNKQRNSAPKQMQKKKKKKGTIPI